MGKNGSSYLPSFKSDKLNSLPFKFSMIQFCIVGLIIASSTWLILSIEKKHHQETQLSLSQNLGLTIVAQLQQTTSKIEALAASMASVGETYAKSPAQLTRVIPALLNIDRQDHFIAGGGLWPEPGAFDLNKKRDSYFWAKGALNEFNLVKGYNDQNGSGYHSETWYKPTRYYPIGTTYWSDAYIDPYTKETMITASVPMWVEHEFIGVSTVDLALSSLKSFFNKLELHQGYLFALDSNNNVLAHPDDFSPKDPAELSSYLSQPFKHFTQQQPAYADIQTEIERLDTRFIQQTQLTSGFDQKQLTPLLNTMDLAKRQRLLALINANTHGLSTTSERSSSLILKNDPISKEPALVSIFHMPKTYWKIVLVTPLSEVGNKEHAITAQIGFYLLFTQLIALVVLIGFQHKIFIKPISKMVNALQQGNIAKLELTANQRNDEIGKLAKAFISRSQQLEIAYSSLDAGNVALEQQLAMQKQAKSELNTHKDQLNDLLNSSQNLICIKDKAGCYSLVNDRFCEVLGKERSEVIGAKDSDLFPNHIAEIIAEHDRVILTSQSPQSFEQPIPTNQGEITYQVTKYPIHDNEGNIIALGAMAFDISTIKAHNEELSEQVIQLKQHCAHSEMQIEQLHLNLNEVEQTSISIEQHREQSLKLHQIGAQSHKLMPQMITDLLKQQLMESEQIFTAINHEQITSQRRQELIAIIVSQTDRIRHLLNLVVPQSEEIKSVHAKQFVEHLLATLEPQCAELQIKCRLICPETLTLNLPPWSLLTLLYKLIQGAITHGFKEGVSRQNHDKEIIIELKRDLQLSVSVTDNGQGLSASELLEINNHISEHTAGGTLAEMSLWLEMEFKGKVVVSSVLNQYTTVTCTIDESR
ncbi:PAS domain-containing protein [Shewanella sp. UCD-KL12]|uniref:PAS domain-containing protein n=1 Tax=Shewanella sp. UCD-KL12 TaxID=1917163 RepID=UPI000970F756|nr:PAS domain-containing protein [Shewanella sp. UCD-KL12]